MEPLTPTHVSLDEASGAILAHLDPSDYGFTARPLRWNGSVFAPKPELHITICAARAGDALAAALKQRADLADEVRAAIQAHDWRFTRQPQLAHIAKRAGVETLVQRVDLPALPAFYDLLRRWTGTVLEVPPAHVTLYTLGVPRGIGIATEADFQRMQRAILTFDQLEVL